MSEKQYYKCAVKVEYENDKGQVKSKKEEYLVNAVNATDVEKQVADEMEGAMGEWEVVQISLTKILAVLDN